MDLIWSQLSHEAQLTMQANCGTFSLHDYSETSYSGPSHQQTTSIQWTAAMTPIAIIIHFSLPPNDNF